MTDDSALEIAAKISSVDWNQWDFDPWVFEIEVRGLRCRIDFDDNEIEYSAEWDGIRWNGSCSLADPDCFQKVRNALRMDVIEQLDKLTNEWVESIFPDEKMQELFA